MQHIANATAPNQENQNTQVMQMPRQETATLRIRMLNKIAFAYSDDHESQKTFDKYTHNIWGGI